MSRGYSNAEYLSNEVNEINLRPDNAIELIDILALSKTLVKRTRIMYNFLRGIIDNNRITTEEPASVLSSLFIPKAVKYGLIRYIGHSSKNKSVKLFEITPKGKIFFIFVSKMYDLIK